jgi:hypothetical protein
LGLLRARTPQKLNPNLFPERVRVRVRVRVPGQEREKVTVTAQAKTTKPVQAPRNRCRHRRMPRAKPPRKAKREEDEKTS